MILFYGILLSSDFLTGKQALDALISSAVALAAMTCGFSCQRLFILSDRREGRGQFWLQTTGIVVVATTFFASGIGMERSSNRNSSDDLFSKPSLRSD
ncbi:MAG: hypothetical protein H6883_07900 [Rhodobiaceae bacterium]|nr:hypothetical protein [Rhodobiaceae bacterium]